MESIRIVNEVGYKALCNLARNSPELFTEPDPNRLEECMITEAGTESVWGRRLELKGDLQSLNAEKKDGPRPDAGHSRTLRAALPDITLPMASDVMLWASVNCFALANYVPVRWRTSNIKKSKPASFVKDHWLQYSGSDGRKWNAAARLWWMGELAERISKYSGNTADELLNVISKNVNFYHQTIDRTYLAANPKLLAVLYDVFLDNNEHLNITKNISDMLKSLNLRAAAMSLDMMDYDELRCAVKEAKPPKE